MLVVEMLVTHSLITNALVERKKNMTALTTDTDSDNSSSSSSYHHNVRPRYREGQRFCTACTVWWKPEEYLHTAPYCPSRFCKRLLRTKPRSRRQRALTNEGRITRY